MPAKLTTKGWITRARAVHGSRYNYSLVVYRTSAAIVVIGCTIHGLFAQAAYNHLQGQGCPACRAARATTPAAKATQPKAARLSSRRA